MGCTEGRAGTSYLDRARAPGHPNPLTPIRGPPTMTPGRLPWEPLSRILRSRADSADYAIVPVLDADHGLWCDAAAAIALNTSRRQVMRWKTEGLTVRAADTVCAWLSLHPTEIWGTSWACVEIGESVRRQARKRTRQRPTADQRVGAAVRIVKANQRALIARVVHDIIAAVTVNPVTLPTGCDSQAGAELRAAA
jgi:hypothetical protein